MENVRKLIQIVRNIIKIMEIVILVTLDILLEVAHVYKEKIEMKTVKIFLLQILIIV